ncbi:MAG: tetratricopeptide repeat protein [Acidobacteriota bacterium]|nr:MAG: tetratricopeptide repeat protein [Acidobacteriota bacterium]
MRILKSILAPVLGLMMVCAAFGQSAERETDTVMVLPFENGSGSEFNWVGESIADSLTDLLKVPGLGVISNQERKIIQQRLKMPPRVLPSVAASLKLAREGGANLLIVGRYNVEPEKDDVAASITINAKIISVNEGRFLSEEFPDGSRKTREIVLLDALGNLQSLQGQLAYQVLYQRDKALEYPQNHFIELAAKVPARAFEAYIKGLLTPVSDSLTRANYLKNAVRIYAEESEGGVYADAAVELGHLYLDSKNYDESLMYFALVPSESPLYPEAAFYSGLVRWQEKDYEQALAVLSPLAQDLKLTSVYNTIGAIAVEAARREKKDDKKSAKFLSDGIGFLERAAESEIDDTSATFNLGFALMQREEYTLASDQFRTVLDDNANDGEAQFLLAKSLEKMGETTAVATDDRARRLLAAGNRYANLESEWKRGSLDSVDLRVRWPTRREFVSVVFVRDKGPAGPRNIPNETETLLASAKGHYDAGRDESAMEVLRRILVQEPMSAESYLLLGKIHLRRGDVEQALSAFKTALFWKNGLVEGHVFLGRIYMQKGDCLQAKNYSRSALEIDPDNEEAIAFERQVERCSR